MSRLGTAFVVAAAMLAASPAHSLGTFVGPPGTDVRLVASRNIVVRHADRVQIISQVKYDGAHESLVWLVPIPNFNNPVDQGVRIEAFNQGGFDELEERTRPTLEGECEGVPSGMTTVIESHGFGPAPNSALPSRAFIVQEVLDGDLTEYLGSVGLEASAAVQAGISGMIDQNFMFYAIRISADDLGVDRVDPVISISYPLAAGQQVKIPLLPMASAVGMGNRVDLILWILDRSRVQSNLTTRTLDAAELARVEFVGAADTNYEAVFDEVLATRQTQMFITEAAGPAAALDDAALNAVLTASGATHLTRLRTRILEAALRANATTTLRESPQGDVDRTLRVKSFGCGAMPPDAGMEPEPDLGPGGAGGAGGAGGGPVGGAGGGLPAGGSGGGGGDSGGGGSSGGCHASAFAHVHAEGWLSAGLVLFFAFTLSRTVRRRRT